MCQKASRDAFWQRNARWGHRRLPKHTASCLLQTESWLQHFTGEHRRAVHSGPQLLFLLLFSTLSPCYIHWPKQQAKCNGNGSAVFQNKIVKELKQFLAVLYCYWGVGNKRNNLFIDGKWYIHRIIDSILITDSRCNNRGLILKAYIGTTLAPLGDLISLCSVSLWL